PSISTTVELTVRPRSATPEEPAAKPPVNEFGIEPLLSAEIERTTSESVVRPLRWIWTAEITVTGEGVSTSMRGMAEPVTTMDCNCCACFADGGCDGGCCVDCCCAGEAGGGAFCARAAASGVIARPAMEIIVMRFMGEPPAWGTT